MRIATGSWLLAAALVVPALAAPPSIVNEDRILLRIRAVTVEGDDTRTYEEKELEVSPEEGGHLDLRVPWPPSGVSGRLTVNASGRPGPPGGVHAFRLDCTWAPPGETPVRANREYRLRQGKTSFLEVFNRDGRHLTVAVRAEHVLRPVLRRPNPAATPVRFHVAVERILEGRAVPLETNDLKTLLGEDVGYAFRLGEGESLESLDLRLRPVLIEGSLIEVEVSIRGTLWIEGAPLFVDRRQRLVTSRGAASSVVATDGDPPDGFRFVVTPMF